MHGFVQRHRAHMKIDVLSFYGCRHVILLQDRDLLLHTSHWIYFQMMYPPFGVNFVLFLPWYFIIIHGVALKVGDFYASDGDVNFETASDSIKYSCLDHLAVEIHLRMSWV